MVTAQMYGQGLCLQWIPTDVAGSRQNVGQSWCLHCSRACSKDQMAVLSYLDLFYVQIQNILKPSTEIMTLT